MKPAVMINVVVGQVVVAARKQRNLKQAEAAVAAGLLQSGLSRLERGETPFTIGQLMRVAGALGTHMSDIVLATEEGVRALAKQGISVLEEQPIEKERAMSLWLAPDQVEQILAGSRVLKRTATKVKKRTTSKRAPAPRR